MAKAKSFKISELILHLEDIKAEHGDIPVIFSMDEEGNGYNTINEDSICIDCGLCNTVCPARLPLAQTIDILKKQVMNNEDK